LHVACSTPLLIRRLPAASRFPSTTLFRSSPAVAPGALRAPRGLSPPALPAPSRGRPRAVATARSRCAAPRGRCSCAPPGSGFASSEEHTSELQSRENLVCRLLLEKNNYVV